MNTDSYIDPVVKEAVEAMLSADRDAWSRLFTPDVKFIHNGSERNLEAWSKSEIFGNGRGRIVSVEKTEENGKILYARYQSYQWGTFNTWWKFTTRDGKITGLEFKILN